MSAEIVYLIGAVVTAVVVAVAIRGDGEWDDQPEFAGLAILALAAIWPAALFVAVLYLVIFSIGKIALWGRSK